MSKSPVFGLGRNRKHRPRDCLHHPSAANVNMKGKKEKIMGCWCCYCIDFRDRMIYREHMKEMKRGRDET